MAEIDPLAARLAAADADAPAGAAPGAQPAAEQGAPFDPAPWVGIVTRMGSKARPFLPERARAAWTDENLTDFGNELAACAKEYGWTFGGIISHPAVRLAIAGAPLVYPFIEPYLAAQLKLAPPAGAQGAQGTPGGRPKLDTGPNSVPPLEA